MFSSTELWSFLIIRSSYVFLCILCIPMYFYVSYVFLCIPRHSPAWHLVSLINNLYILCKTKKLFPNSFFLLYTNVGNNLLFTIFY